MIVQLATVDRLLPVPLQKNVFTISNLRENRFKVPDSSTKTETAFGSSTVAKKRLQSGARLRRHHQKDPDKAQQCHSNTLEGGWLCAGSGRARRPAKELIPRGLSWQPD
jgi:hypothetical protein